MSADIDELLAFHGWTDGSLARSIAKLRPNNPVEAAALVMDVLGPNYDSYDRELAFGFHAERLGCEYAKIYDAWLAKEV